MSVIPVDTINHEAGASVGFADVRRAQRPARLQEQGERRRYPRQSVESAVWLRVGPWLGGHRLSGRATNFSPTGLELRVANRPWLKPGTRARLRVEVPAPVSGTSHSRLCTVAGTIMWTRRDAETEGAVCGIRFSALISEWLHVTGWEIPRAIMLIMALTLALMIGSLKIYNVLWFWYDMWFQIYSLIVAAYIGSRTGLSLFYRVPQDQGFMPTVTFVIAAKNEEVNIGETIERIYQSRYPSHLYEVLAVDDGSTDGTWDEMNRMTARFPNLRVFRFKTNKGKRHAMALGAQEAKHDILAYVDSDSFVEPEGVYRLVQPFADPRIGAVSGHVKVIIESRNPISKMESVRYFISHRIMKAAESIFGTVTCCPGSFSAYRRSAIMPILDKWLGQTFLGTPATFGDDRSLTNFVLRRYKVIFAENARCWTYVPATWDRYFRQQLRWKKSWCRETTIAVRIMWRKHPLAAISYYTGTLLTIFAPIMVLRNMIVLPLLGAGSCLPYVAGLALIYLFFCSVYLYYTRSRYWGYGLMFAGLYLTVMCWQNYYAMVTVSRNHWGTR